jgi:molybdopterin-binding protein
MVGLHSESLSVSQAAAALGTHPEVVRRWLRQGRLQGSKVGRSWRIPRHGLPRSDGARFPLNRFEGRVRRIDRRSGITWIDLTGNQRLAVSTQELPPRSRVQVQLGAENIFLSRRPLRGVSARNQWRGPIASLVQDRLGVEVHLETRPPLVVWLTPDACRDLNLRIGQSVVAVFKAGACRVHALGRPAAPIPAGRRRSRRTP